MDCTELLEILELGEDSYNQFKENFLSIDALAAEITAFTNSEGGTILTGVGDDGVIIGLSKDDIGRLNSWLSNATSQKIEPPLFVRTKILLCEGKRVLIVSVPRGRNKPYCANKGDFWVKNGADKRRATREELLRLMQASGSLFADEMLTELPIDAIDFEAFKRFYARCYQEELEFISITETKLLENFKLLREERLTLAGLILFGKNVENDRPQFGIKGTRFLTKDAYADKEDIGGQLLESYKKGISFLTRNLHRIPPNDDFNAPGLLEIPLPALQEALANALVHRDYFIHSPIFVNIYDEKVEIVSPGVLPNTVTVDNIKLGIHIERNPILLSFMAKEGEFGYTGRGSGIPRILRLCKERNVLVELTNDTVKSQFKVTFWRN